MQDAPGELAITGTLQREAWLRRVMPPVEQLTGDLWSIPVPIPDNPLRYVSAYAFGTGEGLVLIDAGWGTEESWQSLQAGLRSIGAGIADVRGVLVTHMHFDHIGLAGRVRQASGAWIALHPADHAVLARPDYRDADLAVAREAEFLCGLGASPAEAAAAVGTAGEWEKYTSIALPDRLIMDGELADVPGWKLRAVHTPGHTPGHLCFVDERSRRLFSGDHVLPRITPNISVQRADPVRPARGLPELTGQDARPRRRRDPARARVAVQGPRCAHRRHRRPSRAAARRAAGRDTPPARLHAVAAGRAPDLVAPVGPVQRPDADLRGHRDRRARPPARTPRPGDRQPGPPARVHRGRRLIRVQADPLRCQAYSVACRPAQR